MSPDRKLSSAKLAARGFGAGAGRGAGASTAGASAGAGASVFSLITGAGWGETGAVGGASIGASKVDSLAGCCLSVSRKGTSDMAWFPAGAPAARHGAGGGGVVDCGAVSPTAAFCVLARPSAR